MDINNKTHPNVDIKNEWIGNSQNKLKQLKQEILTNEEYQKYLNLPAKELSKEVFDQVMTKRMNELRAKEGLHPLIYDSTLEIVADKFWKELAWQKWWEKEHPHQDKEGGYLRDRIRNNQLEEYIQRNYNQWTLVSLRENIVSKWSFSIEQILQALIQSPRHKSAIFSPTTIVSFSHTDPIVQIFACKKTDKE